MIFVTAPIESGLRQMQNIQGLMALGAQAFQ